MSRATISRPSGRSSRTPARVSRSRLRESVRQTPHSTALYVLTYGAALVQLFTLSAAATNKNLERFARPLGAVMIILGLYTLVVGVIRYFTVQDALIRGVYPVARISAGLLSFMMLALVIVVFVIILIATPR